VILSDQSLSRRLERAEGAAGARFVQSRARLFPDSGAECTEIAGTYAMYDGPRSPSTQTFGLGLFDTPTADHLQTLESFFENRGAPVFHEVSPLADKSLLPILNERGYRPVELTSVMFMPITSVPPSSAAAVTARLIGPAEQDLWARISCDGWRGLVEFDDLMMDLMRVMAAREDALSFLAELDGEPVAAGALFINEGVALFAGAATIPQWRNRGAQQALHEARFRYAAETGCDLAMVCTEPGSASQRNAERQGFRIAYTRIKWQLT
jgi:GNAT superfamily N-acetyltransferase